MPSPTQNISKEAISEKVQVFMTECFEHLVSLMDKPHREELFNNYARQYNIKI